MVITAFRPKPGKAAELDALTREHVPNLRRLGLATDRLTLAMRAEDGTVVEVFEWVSNEAVDEAHKHPEVRKMWHVYDECSDCIKFADLAEAAHMFPGFTPIDL